MGIGSLMSTAIINKFGTRFSLFIGGIGCIIQILVTILPNLKSHDPDFFLSHDVIIACLFVACTINGFTVGVLWTAANQYIAESSTEENAGFFFSYFWSFFQGSQIIGNIIAAFVLGYLD
jgi:MFS family permease